MCADINLLRGVTNECGRKRVKKSMEMMLSLRCSGRYLMCSLLMLGCLGVVPGGYADTGTLNFSGNVLAGTCSLTVNNGTALTVTAVDSAAFSGQNWPFSTPQDVSFKLDACTGVAGTTQHPTVTLDSGVLADLGSGNNAGYVFAATNSAAHHVGLAILKSGQSSFATNCTSCAKANDTVWTDASKTTLPAAGETFTLKVAATCGPTASCSGVSAGTYSGAVTFKFEYK